jgi:GNAT superfamily N-acetyltransferase
MQKKLKNRRNRPDKGWVTVKAYTLEQRRDLFQGIEKVHEGSFPNYLIEGDRHNADYWNRVLEEHPALQFVLCDEREEVLASGHSLPLYWDGTVEGLPSGYDGALVRGFEAPRHSPNTLCALAVIVARTHRGKGISSRAVSVMKALAKARGYAHLIAPVRPNRKSLYPLTPMERYIRWRREDGAPFDPWLRVHWKLGAQILKVASNSMEVRGSVAQWEKWTGMRFPDSGEYVVPGALTPVAMDLEKDEGVYRDPNVWMAYRLDSDEN